MKRLVVILFFVFSVMAYSQPTFLCSDGSPAAKLTIQFPVVLSPTCQTGSMEVYYCCSLDPVTGRLTIDIKGANIFDARCFKNIDLSSDFFWDIVRKKLIENMINDVDAPCHEYLANVGPCVSPTTFYDFKSAACWQVVNDFLTQSSILQHCGAGFCLVEYSVCIDYSTTTPTIITNKITENETGATCEPGQLFPYPNIEIDPNSPIIPFDYSSPCVKTCGGSL